MGWLGTVRKDRKTHSWDENIDAQTHIPLHHF
jgi:hypothetical protein